MHRRKTTMQFLRCSWHSRQQRQPKEAPWVTKTRKRTDNAADAESSRCTQNSDGTTENRTGHKPIVWPSRSSADRVAARRLIGGQTMPEHRGNAILRRDPHASTTAAEGLC